MADARDSLAARSARTDQLPDRPLEATPALEALLGRLRSRLRVQVWTHGLGTTLTAIAAWLIFAFLADWGLSVPHPVRIFHTVVLVGLIAFFVWRDLLRPLANLPGRSELALLVEREHPELRELLVSAVELQHAPGADANPDLVRHVLDDADRRAQELTTRELVDRKRPGLRLASGVLCAGVLGLVLSLRPQHASIFWNHLLGGSHAWPQRTTLFVEIPLPGRDVHSAPGAEELVLQVARGSDVPVRIVAAGVVPQDVTLHFESGEEVLLAASGDGSFRTLLPSCREDLAFHVTGGDDRDGLPAVRIEVLQPPDIAGVAIAVTPPTYTALPAELLFESDVEVVAGSQVRVHVLTDPADVGGEARLLPMDEVRQLEPAPFPSRVAASASESEDSAVTSAGYQFDLLAEASLRYRFELLDEKGLANPDPGLFAIDVLPDREPQLQIASPTASRVYTVPGGALSVRVRAEDDFGLSELTLEITRPNSGRASDGEDPTLPIIERVLPLTPTDSEGGLLGTAVAGASIRRGIAVQRIEVDELAAEDTPLSAGETFEISLRARDNREPEPQVGRSATRTLHIISQDELLRKVQDQLARARQDASDLVDLQREKRGRVEELLQALQSETPLLDGDSQELLSALAGQRRVEGDAQALTRDLSGVAEAVLYARLDEKAGPLLDLLDQRLSTALDASFQPDAWRALVEARRAGLASSAGFAGQLVEMVGAALVVAEDHATAATAALDRAQAELDAADVFEALLAASEEQDRTLQALELLLERLAEWDNFQSVLALTRDILGTQKALRERTRKFAADK